MSGQVWVSLISLGGVALGGVLSYLVQHRTQQSAERAAFSRPADHDRTDPWFLTTSDAMNRLWVAERLIRVQFPLPVHEAARAYFLDLNRTVWEGLPEGESVRDHLEANRLAFLDAARAALG